MQGTAFVTQLMQDGFHSFRLQILDAVISLMIDPAFEGETRSNSATSERIREP